jgi:hypothetical protein
MVHPYTSHMMICRTPTPQRDDAADTRALLRRVAVDWEVSGALPVGYCVAQSAARLGVSQV